MPVFVKDDVRVLFVHVPKTGGTALEDAFVDDGWDAHFLDRTSTQHPVSRLRRCSPQHMHADLLAQVLRLDRIDLALTVVREPLARFRSEYLWRHRRDPVLDADEVARWGRRVMAQYAEDPFTRDNHIRPQAQFLVPDVRVHRYEDGLQPALDDVAEALGLDHAPALPARVPADGPPSHEVPVRPGLEAALREFYEEDFRRLGYS